VPHRVPPVLSLAAMTFSLENGDWLCPACGDEQFKRNTQCRKCGTPNPNLRGMPGMMPPQPQPPVMNSQKALAAARSNLANLPPMREVMPGDWVCLACSDIQFARNTTCRSCGWTIPGQTPIGVMGCGRPNAPPKPGLSLQVIGGNPTGRPVWSGQLTGIGCGEVRPGSMPATAMQNHQQEMPGDWYCGSCGDLQFARNNDCRKCGAGKPQQAPAQAGTWACPFCGIQQLTTNHICANLMCPSAMMGGAANQMMSQGAGSRSPRLQQSAQPQFML